MIPLSVSVISVFVTDGQTCRNWDDINKEASGAHLYQVWPPLQGNSCTQQSSWTKPPRSGGWTHLHCSLLLPCLDRHPCSAAGVQNAKLRTCRLAIVGSPGEEGEGEGLTSSLNPSSSEHVALMFSWLISSALLSSWSNAQWYNVSRWSSIPPINLLVVPYRVLTAKPLGSWGSFSPRGRSPSPPPPATSSSGWSDHHH